MCGVAGIIRTPEATAKGFGSDNLALDLLDMLWCVRHRGLDATGVAVFETRDRADLVRLRATMPDPQLLGDLETIIARHGRQEDARTYQGEGIFTFYDGMIQMDPGHITALHKAIDNHPRLCVHSLGQALTIYKDQGSAQDVRRRHNIDKGVVSHGIGHVRLATESAEDINAAHPFSSPCFPELAIVHNGQFTNYFNLRRYLESKGVRFKTANDSEMAAHYLAYRMGVDGLSLEDALRDGLEAFDGIFTILAATPTAIGIVKDKLAIKPLLVHEHHGLVLFGSEQISLTPILSDVFANEIDPGVVTTWSV